MIVYKYSNVNTECYFSLTNLKEAYIYYSLCLQVSAYSLKSDYTQNKAR